MRLTTKRNGKNAIPLLMAVCGLNLPYWRIDRADDLHSYLSGDAADKLAAYEDTGLEPDEIKEKVGFMSPVCVGCDGKTADGKRTEKCTYDEDFRKCLERSVHLSELAHAEEQGRLVVLPCNVGDTVYEIDLPEYGVIVCNVLYVDIYNGPFAHVPGSKIVAAVSVGVEVVGGHGKGSSYAFEQDDFGKTVFLSRAEAEAALKGGVGDV